MSHILDSSPGDNFHQTFLLLSRHQLAFYSRPFCVTDMNEDGMPGGEKGGVGGYENILHSSISSFSILDDSFRRFFGEDREMKRKERGVCV